MKHIGFGFLLAAVLAVSPASAETLSGRVSVIDGDTLEMHGQRIRLFGIDAPESGQTCTLPGKKVWRCGTQAARALDSLTQGKTVDCEAKDVDRYGRIVARCFVAGDDLGMILTRSGLAVAYRKYSKAYVGAETAAAQEGLGMWAGTFEMPFDWRRRKP